MENWMCRLRGGIGAALAAPLLLVGCAGIHLYNPGRETTAKDVKTKYTELKLPGVIATEQQNLDALLEEELAVVREAHSLRLDLALLRIVDDELSIARFSRYATHALRVPDLRDEQRAVDAVLEIGQRLGLNGWVLYPTRDEIVAAFSRHRARLLECPCIGTARRASNFS